MKMEVISNKVKECRSDSQKLYALVNNLLGTKASNPLPESNSDEDLAEEFAEFFLSKVLQIRDSLTHYLKYVVTDKDQPKLDMFRGLNEDKVLCIIMSMPVKHCDLDLIPATVMRKLIPHILQEITILVNQSLVHGDFAEVWKTSVCKPLIKSLKLDKVKTSYRPVGNLLYLSKVVDEKAMLQQFMEHCGLHDLMPSYQSAFRKFHSCKTSLLNLVNTALWNMESQHVTSVLVMDLSAAFDLVEWIQLLNVLQNEFGVTGTALKWYKNYLMPRDFVVKVNDSYSTKKSLSSGVVQGSVSGPVAYSAYASTLKYVVNLEDEMVTIPAENLTG